MQWDIWLPRGHQLLHLLHVGRIRLEYCLRLKGCLEWGHDQSNAAFLLNKEFWKWKKIAVRANLVKPSWASIIWVQVIITPSCGKILRLKLKLNQKKNFSQPNLNLVSFKKKVGFTYHPSIHSNFLTQLKIRWKKEHWNVQRDMLAPCLRLADVMTSSYASDTIQVKFLLF